MELADERSLLLDSNECMEAHSDLTNPRKRLSAEVAWLPGIGPKRAGEVLSLLESSPKDLLAVDKLLAIARANLLAAGLARLTDHNADNVAEWILEIAWAFEDIDPEELSVIINEERVVSGFPEVSDLSAVEAEIQERRRYYRQVIKSALDNLSPKELVEAVTVVVESATDDGEEHGPILISDIVDSYEVEAQGFLDKEERNINTLVEKIRQYLDMFQCPHCGHIQSKDDECLKCGIIFHKFIKQKGGGDTGVSDDVIFPLISQLIQIVRNWDTVAQPIQLSAKSRGLDHGASHRVAGLVRGLAIYMFNEHGKLDFSQQLTSMLQEVFAEVGKVAERTAEDANSLDDIAEQRARLIEDAKNRAEEWRREITYEADVGVIFKDKLRISPDGIEWKGHRWDLDSIKRVRWGGIRHTVNGIPTGTIFKIFFGNNSNFSTIELRNEKIYNSFVDRLWRAVGVRLLTEYLEGLRDGKRYGFGDSVMTDIGMEMERKKKFYGTERVFCRWDELVIWNGPGVFCIGKKGDKKLAEAFSYLNEDNIHILEAAIRMFWKRGGDRLSSLLGEDASQTSESQLVVNDVCAIPERGMVVTGRVQGEGFAHGDRVEIIGMNKNAIFAVIKGIEKNKKLIENSVSGDDVGLLLRGIKSIVPDVIAGQIVKKVE
jgi:rubrerythrin